MLLVKQIIDTNDADYIYGFSIMSEEDYNTMINYAANTMHNDGIYNFNVGDQPVYWETFEEFTDTLSVKEISHNEVDILVSCFGSREWGESLTYPS